MLRTAFAHFVRFAALMALLYPMLVGAQLQERWRTVFTNQGVFEFTPDASSNLFVFAGSGGSNSLRKFSADGTRLWALPLTNLGITYGLRGWMAADAMGDVYVAGGSNAARVKILHKVSASGNIAWTVAEDLGVPQAPLIALDTAGHVFMATAAQEPLAQQRLWVGRYDSAGSLSWSTSLPGGPTGSVRVQQLAIDTTGNAMVAWTLYGAST